MTSSISFRQPKIIFYVFAILFLSITTLSAKTIRIGLSLDKKHCQRLENKLNILLKSLFKVSQYKKIIVLNTSGYDKKRNLLDNNNIDIMESGFGLFYEANKLEHNKYKVLLQACYYKDIKYQFLIRGLIFSRKKDNLSLKDIEHCKNIFAVSPASSSGYFLQNAYLKSKGLKYIRPIFTTKQDTVISSVEKTKNSIGFCPNFKDLDLNKFKILYESALTPGGIIFYNTSIDKRIINRISNEIFLFYFNMVRNKTKHINRLFVNKLQQNYMQYLKPMRYKKPWIEANYLTIILLGIIIVLFTSVMYNLIANKLNSDDKNTLNEIKRKQLGFDTKNKWYENIEKAMHAKDSGDYSAAIWKVCGLIIETNYENPPKEEELASVVYKANFMNQLIGKINGLNLDDFHIKPNMPAHDLIEKFKIDICGPIKHRIANEEKYPEILDEAHQKLVKISDIDGPLILIRTFRNFSSHDHNKFLTKEAAEFIIHNIIYIHNKLYESNLFPQK